MADKKAKTLNREQFDKMLPIVRKSEHPLRDEAALRLSYFAGLRACEIANIRWTNNLLDAQGRLLPVIQITSDVSKRSVERAIPMDKELARVLKALRKARPDDEYVFYALHNHNIPQKTKVDAMGRRYKVPDPDYVPGKVTPSAVVQWFKRLYAQVGYEGCSSHSGRRTFITTRARLANLNECSIRDVQQLAGHKRLETTATYIDPSPQQHKLVAAWE